MGWARLDDDFFSHPKIGALLDDERGAAAVGLWTLCLAWAHRHTRQPGKVPGDIPAYLPRQFLGPAGPVLAGLLVKEGLWEARRDEGGTLLTDGWHIHDFHLYLPSEAMSRSRSVAGRKGGQASGKARNEASSLQNEASSSQVEATAKQTRSMAPGTGKGSKSVDVVSGSVRDDVERLCARLADKIEANGSKRPTITQGWRDSCRLLLDKDKRTEAQVTKAIDWSTNDSFWRVNILSMPKLREKYDQLRLAAQRENGAGRPAIDPADEWKRR
jgi:hypothetical protein